MFCTSKRASILTYIRNTTYNLLVLGSAVQQFTLESSCLQSWNHRKIAFEFLYTLKQFYKGFPEISKPLLGSAMDHSSGSWFSTSSNQCEFRTSQFSPQYFFSSQFWAPNEKNRNKYFLRFGIRIGCYLLDFLSSICASLEIVRE